MTSSDEEDIVRAKENLERALGSRFVEYMRCMRRWIGGKITKQEFDQEAREIVTDTYVHLHNEFLLCVISKCNSFSSLASDAAARTIFPQMPFMAGSAVGNKNVFQQKLKRKIKTETSRATKSNSYFNRFVPVDPVKHAPSILTASIEATVASMMINNDFTLEFCARERSLPYAKMIHNRMLVSALDHNLEHVDMKACFLLAEATIVMLKNLIAKLASRSRFKHQLRVESAYAKYQNSENELRRQEQASKRRGLFGNRVVVDSESILSEFELDPEFIKELIAAAEAEDEEAALETDHNWPGEGQNRFKEEFIYGQKYEDDSMMFSESTNFQEQRSAGHPSFDNEAPQNSEQALLREFANKKLNPAIAPVKRLPSTLFDLKNLLQLRNKNARNLMPSHTIYTINMEKLICNMWHQNDSDEDEEGTEEPIQARNLAQN